MFTTFADVFRSVIDKHASLKTKIIRGNQAPFMTKGDSDQIETKVKIQQMAIQRKLLSF